MGAEPDILRGAMARLSKCPAWPARLTAEPAAMFMGISQSKFLSKYRHLAVVEDGNVFWSTRQLQALVDGQFGHAPLSDLGPAIAPPPRDDSWDDLT